MNITRRIADFVAKLEIQAVPGKVLQLSRHAILDTLGVAIFATQTPWGRILSDYATEMGCPGKSTILGIEGQRFSATLAALANGTVAHGFELDDVHYPSISHPGAVVVPATLAIAETTGASGRDVLAAVITGYEVMGRIGAAIARNHLAKGFHPTGTFGAFGAAAAAAKILSLDTDAVENALGIVGSLASGLAQFSETGSMVKRIHAGQAAESGIKAALLARRGFTGPAEILEGKYGFLRVFNASSDAVHWDRLTEGLGKTFVVEDISVKPAAACGVFHAVIDCLAEINRVRKLETHAIDQILVLGHANLVREHNVYEPQSILAAQYSLPFTVGLMIRGNIDAPNVYLDESILSDAHILKAARLVKTRIDEEIEARFPAKFGAKVRIAFKDGQVCEKMVLDPSGSAQNPFTTQKLKSKFLKSTQGLLTENQAAALSQKILGLDARIDMGSIFKGIY